MNAPASLQLVVVHDSVCNCRLKQYISSYLYSHVMWRVLEKDNINATNHI